MIKERNTVYDGFLTVEVLDVETDSGVTVKREVMKRPDAVSALVYDRSKEKFIFVDQFRPGVNDKLVEIVAGTLDKPNEDPKEAINREVLEEIGYGEGIITEIGNYYVSPGANTEQVRVYFIEVGNQIAQGGGLEEEHEEIDIIEMDINEMINYEFKDMKTVIAVEWYISNLSTETD
jgi:ADP-ribose pyrophosphatase